MKIILKCEQEVNAVCVSKRPGFSWYCEDCNDEGAFQVSYQIKVYDREKVLFWDSGRIYSNESYDIEYSGKSLQGHTKYYWKVWVETDTGIYESEEAFFVTGLSENEWKAQWITGDFKNAPIFRKKFCIDMVKDTYAYVCGLGYFELYINKKRVGDDYFSPNQTDYETVRYDNLRYPQKIKTDKRLNYLGYDVTDFLTDGENIVEIWLGNGWYKQYSRSKIEGLFEYDELKMIFQMNSEDFELLSDESWQVTDGPILYNDLFYGEIYDANVDYEAEFRPVKLANVPETRFLPQIAPTDKIMEKITPVKLDNAIYDNGKNLSGFVRIKCKGEKGGKIVIKHSECISENNQLDFRSTVGYEEHDRNQIQTDTYILCGNGTEIYHPHFVWHCFRYFEIETDNAEIIDVETYYIYTSVENTNKFECSNELLNKIHKMYVNSQKVLIHGAVPMDCPHRERLGYTGDGQNSSFSAMYNFDCRNYYEKWINDILDSQNKETGYVPHTAPFRGGAGGPAWGSAVAIVPWNYYLHYGNKKLLKKSIQHIDKWILYLKQKTNEKGLVFGDDDIGWCSGALGDWCLPLGKGIEWSVPHHDMVKLPSELVNTCMFIYCIRIYQKMLSILEFDRYDYSEELAAATEAVNNEYLDRFYSSGTQGCDVFPLFVDIVPEDSRDSVIKSLKDNIEKKDFTFDTGLFGTGYMLSVLAKNGLNDYAYKLMNQTKYPSYGYMVKKGATSVWETWEGSGSKVHGALGCFDFWLYQELAGIKPTAKGGFKEICISPYFCDDIDYVKAEYLTNYGKLLVDWKRESNNVILNVTIPFNVSAKVFVNDGEYDVACGKHSFCINQNNVTIKK